MENYNKKYQSEIVRIAMARAELYAEYPRLYRAFDFVDMVIDHSIPTMGVAPCYTEGGKFLGHYDLLWNPDFLEKLTDKQLQGVLLHEILHILLDHTTNRRPELSKDKFVDTNGHVLSKNEEDMLKHMTWNQATDVAINQLIRDYLQDPKSDFKEGLFPETYNLPKDKNAEFYYKKLLEENRKQLQQQKDFLKNLAKQLEKMGIDSHGSWIEVDEKGNVQKVNGVPFPSTCKSKEQGQGKGEELTEQQKEALEKAKEVLAKIGEDTHIKGWGDSTATTAQIELNTGKRKKTPGWMAQTRHASVHGYDILSQLTRKVPDRRFGLAFPGKRRQQIGNKVLVAVDISGSIDLPLYEEFSAHLVHLLRFAKFDIIFFNAGLCDAQGNYFSPENAHIGCKEFRKGMMASIGGGTDFDPVIQFYNLVRNNYDSLFIFTDGDAQYQTAPKRPREVNWILYARDESYVRGNIKHGNLHFMKRGEYL